MQRRDHWHADAGPDHRDLLPLVSGAVAMGARHHPFRRVAARQRPHIADVDACAERPALARDHDGTRVRCSDLVPGGDDSVDHILINGIHFIGAGQAHMGDVIVIGNGNAAHWILLEFSSVWA